MRRIRFTISSLLAIVLVLGVCIAALRESNEIWDSGVFTLTLGVLLISILFAIHRTESRRAFWIGFALFGWIYLGLSLVPTIEHRLITTQALAYFDSKVPDRSIVIGGRAWDSWSGKLAKDENFIRIGHSLFAVLTGWVGGQLSSRHWRISRASEPSTAVDVKGTTP